MRSRPLRNAKLGLLPGIQTNHSLYLLRNTKACRFHQHLLLLPVSRQEEPRPPHLLRGLAIGLLVLAIAEPVRLPSGDRCLELSSLFLTFAIQLWKSTR